MSRVDDGTIDELGARLYDAYRNGTPLDPATLPDLGVVDGYAVQDAVTDRRRADEGAVVGYKVGFTSAAIRSELDVDEPAYGRVLADTVRPEDQIDDERLIAPKIEPEIAVRLSAPLDPPATAIDALAAIDTVVPVIEVVDSRIEGWDVTAGSAVADDALAARVIHGGRVADPSALDLALEGVEVRRNGERVATGVGADVLGSPAHVVAWLAAALAERGERLTAGTLVSTGSLTELVPFEPGDTVEARFASIGSVTVAREARDSSR
jgi:2-keto-4-pentenoate hydratase